MSCQAQEGGAELTESVEEESEESRRSLESLATRALEQFSRQVISVVLCSHHMQKLIHLEIHRKNQQTARTDKDGK